MGQNWRSFAVPDINMDVKSNFDEVSDQNKKHVIANWRKGYTWYKVSKNLAALCPNLSWKAELRSNEIRYLTQEISKQSVEGVAWFLLNAYSKIQKKMN